MIATRAVHLIAFVICALALTGCRDSYEWNQKVTVVIETPQGERTGSSVMHVEWTGGIPFFTGDMRGGGYKLAGEAPVIDLGGGRYLFALLRGMDGLAHQAITGGRDPMSQAGQTIKQAEAPVKIAPKLSPMLVTFTEINDPKTVRRVDPTDLTAAFGPGYALKAITLEITDEPVTTGGIGKVLRWSATVGDGMLDGRHVSTISAENRLANDLSRLDFERR